jgi:membrane protease YdiL (CAAX protease family)
VGSLSVATYIATPERGVLYFLFYAVLGASIFGIGLPVYWTLVKKRQQLENLGITGKNLLINLIVQLLLTILLYYNQINILRGKTFTELFPLLTLILAIGLFKAIFWRGWVLTNLEESFGTIPAIILGSLLYAAYHIGYGMDTKEMVFLFFIGIMFAVLFVLARSIFILWPFFQPVGQLLTISEENLSLPLIASVGFLEAFIAMIVIIFVIWKFSKRIPFHQHKRWYLPH